MDVNLLRSISDTIARESFIPYLSRNVQKRRFKIVVSPIMKELFDKVRNATDGENTYEEETGYLIMGPHGTGKTTTLFWLYHNFKDNSEYDVYSVPLELQSIRNIRDKLTSGSTTKKILLLADLNELHSCTPKDIGSLTELQLLVRDQFRGFVIMAASSLFLGTLYVSPKEIRSRVRTLFDSMSQIEAVPCFDVAKSVAKVFYPGIDNETAEWLANTTGNNPLLIAHYKRNLSSQTYKAIISDTLHPWWCEIYESLIPGDHRLSNTRSHFISNDQLRSLI